MAQLVIKRASWWESNSVKQAMVWTPIATLQMGTLVGLGYFHHRLDDLETRTESLVSLDAAINQSARAVLRQEDRPAALMVQERALPKPAPVSLQVMLNHPETLNTMSAGEDFSGSVLALVGRAGYALESAAPVEQVTSGRTAVTLAAPPSGQPIKSASSKKTVPAATVQHASAKKAAGQPVVKTARIPHLASSTREAAYATVEAARTAAANRMGLHEEEALLHSAQFRADKSLDAIAPSVPIVTEDASPLALPSMGGKPLPIGSVVWIYLGERRDYGWYGQRLHISPDSGLPEVGKSYHTQEVHGIYDRPHGDRAMGGFQQGDLVTILEVLHETNNGVWAKVRKAQSVGRVSY